MRDCRDSTYEVVGSLTNFIPGKRKISHVTHNFFVEWNLSSLRQLSQVNQSGRRYVYLFSRCERCAMRYLKIWQSSELWDRKTRSAVIHIESITKFKRKFYSFFTRLSIVGVNKCDREERQLWQLQHHIICSWGAEEKVAVEEGEKYKVK